MTPEEQAQELIRVLNAFVAELEGIASGKNYDKPTATAALKRIREEIYFMPH